MLMLSDPYYTLLNKLFKFISLYEKYLCRIYSSCEEFDKYLQK